MSLVNICTLTVLWSKVCQPLGAPPAGLGAQAVACLAWWQAVPLPGMIIYFNHIIRTISFRSKADRERETAPKMLDQISFFICPVYDITTTVCMSTAFKADLRRHPVSFMDILRAGYDSGQMQHLELL